MVINEFRRHFYSPHWQSGTRMLENYTAGRSSNFIFGGTLFGNFVSFFSYPSPSLAVYPIKMVYSSQKTNGRLYCRSKEVISCQCSDLEGQFRIEKKTYGEVDFENNTVSKILHQVISDLAAILSLYVNEGKNQLSTGTRTVSVFMHIGTVNFRRKAFASVNTTSIVILHKNAYGAWVRRLGK